MALKHLSLLQDEFRVMCIFKQNEKRNVSRTKNVQKNGMCCMAMSSLFSVFIPSTKTNKVLGKYAIQLLNKLEKNSVKLKQSQNSMYVKK